MSDKLITPPKVLWVIVGICHFQYCGCSFSVPGLVMLSSSGLLG
ncbi:hypothetical protein NL418_009565 [Escherichia coli]|nr:hypothetical protein [Escherichia coli]WCQ55253.1 hypothetical protein NL418_009565 [Escherichia coli]